MKPGKHQRSKQRCQDLGWKVHDRAQSFVLALYIMHELRKFLLVSSSVQSKQLLCFVHGQGQKSEQNLQQRVCWFSYPFLSINYGLIDLNMLGSLASLEPSKYHKTRLFHDDNLRQVTSEGTGKRDGLMVSAIVS